MKEVKEFTKYIKCPQCGGKMYSTGQCFDGEDKETSSYWIRNYQCITCRWQVIHKKRMEVEK